MSDSDPKYDPLQEDKRLDSLDERLGRASRKVQDRHTAEANRGKSSSGNRMANRVLTDLLGGVVGGLLIGWLLDRWLGTAPWLMLAMLAFGVGLGFWHIWQMSKGEK